MWEPLLGRGQATLQEAPSGQAASELQASAQVPTQLRRRGKTNPQQVSSRQNTADLQVALNEQQQQQQQQQQPQQQQHRQQQQQRSPERQWPQDAGSSHLVRTGSTGMTSLEQSAEQALELDSQMQATLATDAKLGQTLAAPDCSKTPAMSVPTDRVPVQHEVQRPTVPSLQLPRSLPASPWTASEELDCSNECTAHVAMPAAADIAAAAATAVAAAPAASSDTARSTRGTSGERQRSGSKRRRSKAAQQVAPPHVRLAEVSERWAAMQEQLKEMFHETELICSEADPGSVLEREATGLLGRLASRAGSRLSHVAASATSKEDGRSTPQSLLSLSSDMHTNSALSMAPALPCRQAPSPEAPELGQRPATQREDRSKLPPLPSREQPVSQSARRPPRERAASRRGRSSSVEGTLSARATCVIGADGMSECSTGSGSVQTDTKAGGSQSSSRSRHLPLDQREQHAAVSSSQGRSFSSETSTVLPPLARRSDLPPRSASMDRSMTTARLIQRTTPCEQRGSQRGPHQRPAGVSCADAYAHDPQPCSPTSSLMISDDDCVLHSHWDCSQEGSVTSLTAAASRGAPTLVRILSRKGSTTLDWESAAGNLWDCSQQNSVMSTADSLQRGSVPLPGLQLDGITSAADAAARGSQALVRIVSQRGSTVICGQGSSAMPEGILADS